MLQQNCMEHINLMAGEQKGSNLSKNTKNATNRATNADYDATNGPSSATKPTMRAMQREGEQLKVIIESRKATLIAQFLIITKAEKEVLSQIENDPVLKLKMRAWLKQEKSKEEEEFEKDSNLEMFKVLSS